MAHTVAATTLLDGARNLVQLINITGDGASPQLSNVVLVDRSTFIPTDGLELVVERIDGLVSGFTIALSFDATADLIFVQLPNGDFVDYDWERIGGISSNKAGAGANGDILISTTGLVSGTATFLLSMRKS